MAIDADKIFKRLRGEDSWRGSVTLYLNKRLYADFQDACGDIAPSKVIEELMKEFIESARASQEKGKRSK